jgi:hypothetical protein
MARFNNGIMGGFTGIVGHIEGYIRKGQPVMRSRRRKVTKFSDAQLACRQRMKVVNEFTSPITDFVRIGFGVDAAPTTKTANNLAISYQLLHGLKGEYPNLEIDYPKVRVTSGTLEVVQNPTMVLEGSALNFSWENDKIRDNNFEDDQLMILVYYPDRKMASRRYTGAKRGALKDTIKAYKLKPGERLEAYLSFRSDDRTSISNSVYVGSITGEAVIEAPIETIEHKLPQAEPEIIKVDQETMPAIEDRPAAAFKSKLIEAIERTVEARLKPTIEAVQGLTFKSKLIVEIERTVNTRFKQALKMNTKRINKTASSAESILEVKQNFVNETKPTTDFSLRSEVKTELPLKIETELELNVLKKPATSKSVLSSSNYNKKKRPLPINARIKVMQQRCLTGISDSKHRQQARNAIAARGYYQSFT